MYFKLAALDSAVEQSVDCVNGSACTVDKLAPSSTYTFSVSAANAAGEGPRSPEVSAATKQAPEGPPQPPLAPVPLDAPDCESVLLQLPARRKGCRPEELLSLEMRSPAAMSAATAQSASARLRARAAVSASARRRRLLERGGLDDAGGVADNEGWRQVADLKSSAGATG